jgi:hypothetical protein
VLLVDAPANYHEERRYAADVVRGDCLGIPFDMRFTDRSDKAYMGLGLGPDAFAGMTNLKDACRKYDGDFALLWHNSRLADPVSREFYREILRH